MMKLKSRRLFRSCSSKLGGGERVINSNKACHGGGEIEWEVRPGGMLVQKRESCKGGGELIRVRVSMGSHCHDISIGATSTFGELKVVLSLVTGLEPRAQRILYRGKEREDVDHLHMVGVKDSDKVLLLEDPAIKDKKLRAMMERNPCNTAIKV
ncbi:Ubiquitin-like protein [Dioscorea alata]|uniref:Ubiquitin-like protein n=1 Tax=Dioscorea alata TaxID=55571 RepID=A0ACB7W1Q0_DIOAL|nr:Ubiquitin-like protein [Dioscorea alata]